MSDPKYRNAGWLREQYMDKGLSTTKIGSICGVAARTISTWLKRHDIPARPSLAAASKLPIEEHPLYKGGKHTDADWLREKYLSERLSIQAIADEAGSSTTTVHRWLKRHNIPRRPPLGELSGPDHPQYIDGRSHIWD
jgi:IS30 family transposase